MNTNEQKNTIPRKILWVLGFLFFTSIPGIILVIIMAIALYVIFNYHPYQAYTYIP